MCRAQCRMPWRGQQRHAVAVAIQVRSQWPSQGGSVLQVRHLDLVQRHALRTHAAPLQLEVEVLGHLLGIAGVAAIQHRHALASRLLAHQLLQMLKEILVAGDSTRRCRGQASDATATRTSFRRHAQSASSRANTCTKCVLAKAPSRRRPPNKRGERSKNTTIDCAMCHETSAEDLATAARAQSS